jgi:hypothetical protein
MAGKHRHRRRILAFCNQDLIENAVYISRDGKQ